MRINKWILVMSGVLLLTLLAACGGSSEVDAFLDEYEAMVEKYEKNMSGGMDMAKIQGMQEEASQVAEKARNLKQTEWTEKQVKRHEELTQRLQAAMMGGL